MKLCCCVSLQKGVVTIGVISLLASAVFVVMNLVTCVTFEEHVQACRNNVARDVLKAFPACHVLTDASMLMAGRIFIYIQLFVWITEIITSVFLIAAAVKRRSHFLIPWTVVSILVIIILLWNVYQAAMGKNLLHLLLLITAFLIAIYFLIVVRAFGASLSRSTQCCHSFDEQYRCHPRPTTSLQSCCDYAKPLSTIRLDYPPPPYIPFTSEKKGPLPSGLGVKH